jgi:hypothetical protein
MKLLNFEDFLNENFSTINESLRKGDSYLIGDFTSVLLGSTRQLNNRVLPLRGLAVPKYIPNPKSENPETDLIEVNLTTYAFSRLLEDYKGNHPETKYVFLFIGVNDLYEYDSSLIQHARKVREQIIRIFPNAQRFVVSAGSWGWGMTKKIGEGKGMPSEVSKYYKKVWEPLGFLFLKKYLITQYDKQDSPISPDQENPEIKNLAKEILDISEGEIEFYSEDIRSLRDLDSLELDEEGKLINFYDVLQNAVHEGLEISKNLEMSFNPVVERSQVGLNFLGYPLSKFGVDGIFTQEVEDSVKSYKKDNSVEGTENVMDDYFFISLINNLKNKRFTGEDIDRIMGESYQSIDSLGDKQNGPSSFSYTPGSLSSYSGFSGNLGDDEYLIFVQHNQGVAGAASLVNAKYGKGQINSFTRSKGMVNNIPSDMPDYRKQIVEALNSGNDQRAASLFLEMWKIKYASKKETGLKLINTPKYASVKSILEKVSSETGLPFEVLVAIGTIESGLNPNVGNSKYKGLFALNPSTAVKYNPSITHLNVHDPSVNADAAGRMLLSGKKDLVKSLSRTGVLSNLNFS